ncbi:MULTISPECIES: DUF6924 domain-containing protein [Streptomyces]|uniref:DUF6924 domain-containing protein n=1 Tax=Streptomyces canarius TaxID=285453 RepID=A0ABQ3DBP8_9ACTN|nr:hypothetical protein [Streptomyces canarius]GHA70984.1 hypothetical protein GCM10010345_87740 [Streptomyces canarius]
MGQLGVRRVVRLAEAAEAGDWVAFWDVALEAHAAGSGWRGSVWGEVLDAAQRMPQEVREGAALASSARYRQLRDDSGARRALLILLAVISPGLPDAPLVPERQAILATAGHRFEADLDDATLAEAELAAGRDLTAPVIAAIRRSSVTPYTPESIVALGQGLREPILNVGEPWAEQVLLDLAELGEGWTRLLQHALASRSTATPPARWEKTGRALLEALSPQAGAADGNRAEVSERIISWLALVGRPRTIPLQPGFNGEQFDGTVDPYNAPAIRGLVWLLTYLPPHPQAAVCLGSVTEVCLRTAKGVGPGSPETAQACIRMLSSMDDEAASAELARLAASVTHQGTRKLLQRVVTSTITAQRPPGREIPLKSLPLTDDTPLIRTDFSDNAAWQALHTAIMTPNEDGFLAHLHIVDNPAYRDVTTEQVVSLAPAGADLMIVADQTALTSPEMPLLAVLRNEADSDDEAKQDHEELRVIAKELWSIENNISIGNMDWEEFVDACDGDGVFRGF